MTKKNYLSLKVIQICHFDVGVTPATGAAPSTCYRLEHLLQGVQHLPQETVQAQLYMCHCSFLSHFIRRSSLGRVQSGSLYYESTLKKFLLNR